MGKTSQLGLELPVISIIKLISETCHFGSALPVILTIKLIGKTPIGKTVQFEAIAVIIRIRITSNYDKQNLELELPVR